MKRTPFYAIHKRCGAIFGDWGGAEVPFKYGDPDGENLSARSEAALFDLSPRGKLRLEGADRVDFVHRMVASDVRALAPGQSQKSMLLSTKGKLIADFTILALEDAYLLDVEPVGLSRLQAALDKYVIADDVRISDVTDAFSLLSVQGPKASEVVASLGAPIAALAPDALVATQLRGAPAIVVATARFGVTGYDVYVALEAAPAIFEDLRARGARLAGFLAHEALRIESGLPRLGADLDEDTLPPEAGLESAISYTKGCYVGQETIARLKYQGHPNRQLVGLTVDAPEPPPRFTAIYSGETGAEKEVGRLTSACWSPSRKAVIGLSVIRRDAAEAGTTLRARLDGGDVKATVERLPFDLGRPTHSRTGAAASTPSRTGPSIR